ncbi:hypothetical protein K2173_018999 [Erythroxylum novogranatense]|uniref:EF-hand domain-containing protein n=1 Tax=Erythroxylum novogranatense TaxID=1862640 RepID=A0AAV8SSE9_9ROSI|nr:hypothetical protein K2173_018999 [Erythroxylum novogranatense]
MKHLLGTSHPCPGLKSLSNKIGGIFFHCHSPNKYKRLDARLERKMIEVKRTSQGKKSFKSINSIVLRFPQFREGLKNIRSVFEVYDEDANGAINREELKKCLQQLQINFKEEEIEDLFDSCDINGSGEIHFNEFIVLLCLMYLLAGPSTSPHKFFCITERDSLEVEAIFDTMIEAFLFLDKDGDGKLNKKDMIQALDDTCPWEKSPQHIIRTRFKEMDWDRNGQVSFREFLFAFVKWAEIDTDEEITITGS